ncbi:hypothetical protein EON83_22410 [bacterium]|nr:MAG: hypothetical protein EON83_22410 [bacterium]
MKKFSAAVTAGLLVGLVPVAQAEPAAKPLTPSAPIPVDPAGLDFELHTAKTTFQKGETIRVNLLFSNHGTQTLCLNTFHFPPPNWAVFGSFEASPKEETSNPLGDLPPEKSFNYSGPGPARPQLLTENPFGVTLALNAYIRFNNPGEYKIRATTNRVFAIPDGQPLPEQGSFFGGTQTVTSKPLSIEIVPATPEWQQQQVAAWQTYWSKQKPGDMEWITPVGVQRPQNDIRFLNTYAAVEALIERLGQDEFPRSSGSEAYYWRPGLIGFPNRLWLIAAMKDAIKRPDYPVTQGLLDNLATLQALYHVSHTGKETPTNQFWQVNENSDAANWQLTLASLPQKKGRARAMTVHSLLESVWFSNLSKAPQPKQQLPRLVALVPDIFNDLPNLPQQYLLDKDNWKQVKSPRFVEPLLQEWKTVPHAQGWAMERGNLILRRLYELNPTITRPLILREMAAPQPRVSFEVLALLDDKVLPQLQNLWWTHLNSNGPDHDIAALLIGRYATTALKGKVQKEYAERKRNGMLSFDVNRGLRNYLVRIGA